MAVIHDRPVVRRKAGRKRRVPSARSNINRKYFREVFDKKWQGFSFVFQAKFFPTQERATAEANKLLHDVHTNMAIIKVNERLYTFVPCNAASETVIARVCRIFGGEFVDLLIVMRI